MITKNSLEEVITRMAAAMSEERSTTEDVIASIDKDGHYCEQLYLPSGHTQVPRRPSEHHRFDGKQWQLDTDAHEKARRAKIKAEHAKAIDAGFKSSALGRECTYGNSITDQINLLGCMLDALSRDHDRSIKFYLLKCSSPDTGTIYPPHSPEATKKVFADYIDNLQNLVHNSDAARHEKVNENSHENSHEKIVKE